MGGAEQVLEPNEPEDVYTLEKELQSCFGRDHHAAEVQEQEVA
jgi:hypothetical protein